MQTKAAHIITRNLEAMGFNDVPIATWMDGSPCPEHATVYVERDGLDMLRANPDLIVIHEWKFLRDAEKPYGVHVGWSGGAGSHRNWHTPKPRARSYSLPRVAS